VTRVERTLPKRVHKNKAGAPTGHWWNCVRYIRAQSCPLAHAIVIPKRPVCFCGECPALRCAPNKAFCETGNEGKTPFTQAAYQMGHGGTTVATVGRKADCPHIAGGGVSPPGSPAQRIT